MKEQKIKIAIIGASGYTGVELIRLLVNHQKVEIKELIANKNAGQEIAQIYPHLLPFALPILKKIEEVDFADIDLVFCCLPHTTSQAVIKNLMTNKNYKDLKIIDLSADFRLTDGDDYYQWYQNQHIAPEIQKQAIYGLSEINHHKIKNANLIANPGCYPTSALLPLLPLIENKLIDDQNIIIDSKSAVSGAGKSLKEDNLFCEVNESIKAYNIGKHRHIAEIEQELSIANGKKLNISFTPHLIPINRGIISTIYVGIKDKFKIADLQNCLQTKYQDEYFINITKNPPSTKDVKGSNFCHIGVFESRIKNQAIIISVIDNLVKGASGQAVQNMNIMFDFAGKEGLVDLPALL